MVRELLNAGLSPQAANAVAAEAEKLEERFGITAQEAQGYILKAVRGGQLMTAQEMQELAAQLDADR